MNIYAGDIIIDVTMRKAGFVILCQIVLLSPLIVSLDTQDTFIVPKSTFVMILAGAMVIMFGFSVLENRDFRFPKTYILTAILLFIAVCFFSAFRTRSLVIGFREFFWYLCLFSIPIFMASLRDFEKKSKIIVFLLISSYAFVSIHSIFQSAGRDFWFWEGGVFGTIGNPDGVGGEMAMVLPLSVCLFFFSGNNWIKALTLVIATLNGLAMLVSQTRGAFLGTAVSAVLFFIIILKFGLWRRIRISGKWIFGIALILGMAVLFLAVVSYLPGSKTDMDSIVSRIKTIFAHKEGGISQRFLMWSSTMLMLRDNPVFGMGLGEYKLEYLNYQGQYLQNDITHPWCKLSGDAKQAHNEYLQLFAELGLTGLGLYIWILLILYKMIAVKLRKVQQGENADIGIFLGTALGINSCVAHSFFSFPFHIPSSAVTFFILIGMGIKLSADFPAERQLSAEKKTPGLLMSVAVLVAVLLSFSVYRFFSANVFLKKGFKSAEDAETAVSYYEKGIYLDKYDGELHADIAMAYEAIADKSANKSGETAYYDTAISEYRKALEIFNDPSIMNNMGNVYDKLEKRKLAISAYRVSMRIAPGDNIARNNMAGIFAKIGEPEKAEKLLDDSLQLDHSDGRAYFLKGNISLARKEYDKAISEYRNAIERGYANGETYNNLGSVYAGMNDNENARMIFEDGIRTNPGFAVLYSNLSVIYRRLGRPEPVR